MNMSIFCEVGIRSNRKEIYYIYPNNCHGIFLVIHRNPDASDFYYCVICLLRCFFNLALRKEFSEWIE